MERTVRRQQTRFCPLPPASAPLVVGSLVAIMIGVEGGWVMAETNRRKRIKKLFKPNVLVKWDAMLMLTDGTRVRFPTSNCCQASEIRMVFMLDDWA